MSFPLAALLQQQTESLEEMGYGSSSPMRVRSSPKQQPLGPIGRTSNSRPGSAGSSSLPRLPALQSPQSPARSPRHIPTMCFVVLPKDKDPKAKTLKETWNTKTDVQIPLDKLPTEQYMEVVGAQSMVNSIINHLLKLRPHNPKLAIIKLLRELSQQDASFADGDLIDEEYVTQHNIMCNTAAERITTLLDHHLPKHVKTPKQTSMRAGIGLCGGLLEQLFYYIGRLNPSLATAGRRILDELLSAVYSTHQPDSLPLTEENRRVSVTQESLPKYPPIHTLSSDAHGLELLAQRYIGHTTEKGWGELWATLADENDKLAKAFEYQVSEIKQAQRDIDKAASAQQGTVQELQLQIERMQKREEFFKDKIRQLGEQMKDIAATSAPKLMEEISLLKATLANFLPQSAVIGDANTEDLVKLRTTILDFVTANLPHAASKMDKTVGRKDLETLKGGGSVPDVEQTTLTLFNSILQLSIQSSKRNGMVHALNCTIKSWNEHVQPDAYIRFFNVLFPDVIPSFQTQTALSDPNVAQKIQVIMSTLTKLQISGYTHDEIKGKSAHVHIMLILEALHKLSINQSWKPTFVPAVYDDKLLSTSQGISTQYIHPFDITDNSIPVKHVCHQVNIMNKISYRWLNFANFLSQSVSTYGTVIARKGGMDTDDTDIKELNNWMAEAQRAQTAGDYQKALDAYNKALAIAPSNAPSHYRRGLLKHDHGDFEGARLDYVKATGYDASWREGKHQGRELTDPETAQLEAFEEEALAKFHCGLDTHHIDSLLNEAKESDYETALALIDEALKLDPVSAPAFYTRAGLKHDMGDFEGARQDYVKGTVVDPNWREGNNNERDILKDAADIGESTLSGTEKQQINGFNFGTNPDKEKVDLLLSEAKALEAVDADKALRLYDDAIAHDDMNPTPYYRRGWLKHETGDFEGARLDYIKSTALDIDWREGRHEENDKHMLDPTELDDDEKHNVEFRDNFHLGQPNVTFYEAEVEEILDAAEQARDNNDTEAALEAYDKAIEAAPQAPTAYYRRGTLKHETGDFEGARLDYISATAADDTWRDGANKEKTEALKPEPEKVEHTQDTLGHYNLDDGYKNAVNDLLEQVDNLKGTDNDAALKALDDALDMNPNYAPSWYRRGTLKHEIGDFDGARKDYVSATRVDMDWRDGQHAGRTDLIEEEEETEEKQEAFAFNFGEAGDDALSPSKVNFDFKPEEEPVFRSERMAPRGRRRSLWHDLNEKPEQEEWQNRQEEKKKEEEKKARARSSSVRRKSVNLEAKTPRRRRSISNAEREHQKALAKQRLEDAMGNLPTIEFEPNKAILKSGEVSGLNAVADILLEFQLVKLQVIGTTVNADKMALAHRRAEACISYLVQKGITVTRLEPKGMLSDKKATLFEPIA